MNETQPMLSRAEYCSLIGNKQIK